MGVRHMGGRVVSMGTQGVVRREQFVQLLPGGPVNRQLLPDLLQLHRHWGALSQPLHCPLQCLQQRLHLIVKLGKQAERSDRKQSVQTGSRAFNQEAEHSDRKQSIQTGSRAFNQEAKCSDRKQSVQTGSRAFNQEAKCSNRKQI